MLSLTWLRALVRRQPGRLAGAAIGVAAAVALLAAIGSFVAGAKATMTRRATSTVPVDWQVAVQPGADQGVVLAAVEKDPRVRLALPVGYAQTSGLQATVQGTMQTTGPGVVLGVPPAYAKSFPREIRPLAGSDRGVLVAQQTAANLRVAPGDTVTVGRAGLEPVNVRVDGVVDLPQANSLFQKVGAPVGSQPQAPPDNVVLLPSDAWQAAFSPLATARPDLVATQVHARLSHALPNDPAAAFVTVTGTAHHLEALLPGAALVGDNLGAALDAARSDALYAQVLFLFLGLPGAILAGLLTAAVASTGAERRRHHLALLRTRGATASRIVRLAAAEAALVGVIGVSLGLGVAAVVGRVSFDSATFGASASSAAFWGAGAALAGLAIAAVAVVGPARTDARAITVAAARGQLDRARRPLWLRAGLDLWLVAAALAVFWVTGRGNYALVLAPEGVPTVSVSYWALAGPALLWLGAGLLTWRLTDTLLRRGRPVVGVAARPLAGGLARTVAAALGRQRKRLAWATALVALSGAFAISTAVFNATYRQQVAVDARLTNGADVTVSATPGAPLPPASVQRVSALSGVRAAEPMQHRFAYVGADLQDLFGVRPGTVGAATRLQDAYFSGGTAAAMMGRLRASPDGLLLSAETVKDFQLSPGDVVRLRLRDGRTGALTEVPFHYVGVAKEFPTAPKDSFLVANADYVAARTGNAGADVLLLDVGHSSPRSVATRVRQIVGTGATVTDVDTSRQVVGSSLTAVDLAGLTRVELAFALALAAASCGLLLGLSVVERRRSLAITRALGARPRQVAAFVRTEIAVVVIVGAAAAVVIGWTLAAMLVKVLTGVFDPPPSALALPWTYLTAVGALVVASAALASEATVRTVRRPLAEVVRDL
ncbi:MAG: putative ABC-type transport system involved in lysophospholipase biosynthesis, permease component [Acidimicrobiales bacterium]|nr:putative ABC-type transport system involved in lysophospholipase biosynthesis, permease component [Acidimicrobiales bacterium]